MLCPIRRRCRPLKGVLGSLAANRGATPICREWISPAMSGRRREPGSRADPSQGAGSARRSPGVILFIHIGGFAFCSPETHERCARSALAVESGMPVVLPDYRLLPEDPFPAGLKDVVSALRSVLAATKEAGVRSRPSSDLRVTRPGRTSHWPRCCTTGNHGGARPMAPCCSTEAPLVRETRPISGSRMAPA